MFDYKIPNAGKIITGINIVLVFIVLVFCMNF